MKLERYMEAMAMKEPEGIIEATQAIIHCWNADSSQRNNDWLVANHFFYIEIEKASPEEILQAILVDTNLELPFFIKCDLHQKLIYLDDISANLTRFADFLRFHGPSWNYLADYFEKIVATRAQNQLNFKT